MRDALPIRLRRAPFHERREPGVPFGAVDERRRALGRRVAEDLPERGVGLRRVEAVDAERQVEREPPLLDALQQQHRRQRPAHVADQIRRIRRGAHARRDVLESEALFPDDHSVAHNRRRHARDAALLPESLEVALEDGNAAGQDRRLLLRPDVADTASTRSGRQRESCPVVCVHGATSRT